MTDRTCSIDGCTDPVHGYGWCRTHYTLWKNHGDPLWTAEIPRLPGEHWLPVVGWEGIYEVSDLGRVYSLPRKFVPAGYLTKGIINAQGYLAVMLSCRPRGLDATYRPVHILVAAAFLGPRPDGMEVRHLDGVRTNPVLSNLIYGTPGENQLDSVQHGTHNMARKTKCKHGHDFTPENTRITADGRRICRTCIRDRMQAWREANRELARQACREAYYRRRDREQREAG
jgi:hypothetical protein